LLALLQSDSAGKNWNTPKVVVDLPIAYQLFDVIDAFEALAFEIFERDPRPAILIIELLYAAPRSPLRFERV
jgi:hypothetical protein